MEIGKDDDGRVVGVRDARRLLEEIPNKINSTMAIIGRIINDLLYYDEVREPLVSITDKVLDLV